MDATRAKIFICALGVLLLIGAAYAMSPEELETALAEAGIQAPVVTVYDDEVVVQYVQPVDGIESELALLETWASLMAIASEELAFTGIVTVGCIYDDGQILAVSADPAYAAEFLDGIISEEEFLDVIVISPLTRGTPFVEGRCEPANGESCLSNPVECACQQGERCEPGGEGANTRGCAGAAPANASLVGSEYVCDVGYEWNRDRTACVVLEACTEGSFQFEGMCYCEGGYVWNSAGAECVPAAGDDFGSILVVVVILALLAGAGYYFLRKKRGPVKK